MNIKDIAKIAGVGVSTVSRVINNHPDVKDETRERIMKIIEESNYVPNNSARVLKQITTNNIGVLAKGVFNPFFSEMINIIGNKITESGYSMILQQNDYKTIDDIDNLIGFVKEKRLKGVICLGGDFLNNSKEYFNDISVPIVLTSVNTIIDNNENKDNYSSISIDNIESAYKATEYLIKNGHRNIVCMLGGKQDLGIGFLRLKGYKNALKDNKIEFNENNVIEGNYEYEAAYEETLKVLKENKNVTAIFAISDIMAVGAAKAVSDAKLKIGKDISIMGFDGLEISKYYTPSISTIKQPKEKMAIYSAQLLLNIINKKEKHKHLVLPTTLIKGESCGKV